MDINNYDKVTNLVNEINTLKKLKESCANTKYFIHLVEDKDPKVWRLGPDAGTRLPKDLGDIMLETGLKAIDKILEDREEQLNNL